MFWQLTKFTEEKKKAQALSGIGCHSNPNPEFPLVWKKERWYTYSQSNNQRLLICFFANQSSVQIHQHKLEIIMFRVLYPLMSQNRGKKETLNFTTGWESIAI